MTTVQDRSPLAGHMLTARQLEIATLVSQGMSNGAIARRLGVSEDTVKTHLFRAYKQAGAQDRAHLVAICLSAGVIPKVSTTYAGAVSR